MNVHESNEEQVLDVYGVAWGHYVDKDMPTQHLGTDSLGSCFAFIRIDKKNEKVFFAHVSNDGEKDWLIHQNFETSPTFPPLGEEIQYLYVKGSQPNPHTTDIRINELKEKYGGQ